jgi:hypothetical protein
VTCDAPQAYLFSLIVVKISRQCIYFQKRRNNSKILIIESLINSVNFIIWLENKILTTNKMKKTTMIQCKKWMLANIKKIIIIIYF